MAFHVENVTPPTVSSPAHRVFAHAGGVLILPPMLGETPTPAWWSADGRSFVEATKDLGAVAFEGNPVIGEMNGLHWSHEATATGIAFFRWNGRIIEATVGPHVVFRPCAYASPVEYKFRLGHLTIDEGGTWWAAGHASNDDLIGQVFTSPDGVTWQPVQSKFHGAVERLVRKDGKMIALHYKHITEIAEGGVTTKIASLKDHVIQAVFAHGLMLGLGVSFIGVLPDGGKRAKYIAPPAGNDRYHVAPVEGGFVLGGRHGLWSSTDGITWSAIPSFTGSVSTILPSASGLVVVSTNSEIYLVRTS